MTPSGKRDKSRFVFTGAPRVSRSHRAALLPERHARRKNVTTRGTRDIIIRRRAQLEVGNAHDYDLDIRLAPCASICATFPPFPVILSLIATATTGDSQLLYKFSRFVALSFRQIKIFTDNIRQFFLKPPRNVVWKKSTITTDFYRKRHGYVTH